MKTISIILPVYNVEKYLKECLDSIIQQTYPHLQIICVDDGSTDSSGDILDEYARNDNRILVIHQENGGVGKAFNAGYSKAMGCYIGYIESDDFIEKTMYEKLLDRIQRDGSDIARCNFVTFDSNSKREIPASNTLTTKYTPQSPLNPLEYEEIFLYHPATWSNLYRRSLIDQNNIKLMETPGASFQDGPFSFQTLSCAKKISLIDEDLYHYRLHGGQSIRTAKTWFYEKMHKNIETYIANIAEKDRAQKIFTIYLRGTLYSYEYSLQIMSKDEILSMCHFISQEIKKISTAGVNVVCITRREKILYFIFRNNFTYLLYLALIPVTTFTRRSYRNRKIMHFVIKILG